MTAPSHVSRKNPGTWIERGKKTTVLEYSNLKLQAKHRIHLKNTSIIHCDRVPAGKSKSNTHIVSHHSNIPWHPKPQVKKFQIQVFKLIPRSLEKYNHYSTKVHTPHKTGNIPGTGKCGVQKYRTGYITPGVVIS
jgi:hypothetical protein